MAMTARFASLCIPNTPPDSVTAHTIRRPHSAASGDTPDWRFGHAIRSAERRTSTLGHIPPVPHQHSAPPTHRSGGNVRCLVSSGLTGARTGAGRVGRAPPFINYERADGR